MQYQVEDRIFINDSGNQVKYKRLVVTGYLNGNLETIELPISKEQALIYRAMSNTAPEVTTRQGGEVDTTRKPAGSSNEDEGSWLN